MIERSPDTYIFSDKFYSFMNAYTIPAGCSEVLVWYHRYHIALIAKAITLLTN